jgi:hypothetical protein
MSGCQVAHKMRNTIETNRFVGKTINSPLPTHKIGSNDKIVQDKTASPDLTRCASHGLLFTLGAHCQSPRKATQCRWIGVTNIEALYQQYLPTNAVQSPLEAKPWGLKEFFIKDPFRNLILFAESISEEEARAACSSPFVHEEQKNPRVCEIDCSPVELVVF